MKISAVQSDRDCRRPCRTRLIAILAAATAISPGQPVSAAQPVQSTNDSRPVITTRTADTNFGKCTGERFEAKAGRDANSKKDAVDIVFCAPKGASKAETIGMLERASSRIEADAELTPEDRSEILSQLNARIAEVKAR